MQDIVLAVDDNPTNLRVLHEILQDQGYTILTARSGPRAIEVARRTKPALVLLDIQMPGMDGFEVCRQLKADPELADAAVVFLSALRDTGSKVTGLEVGAVDFVSKPFEVEEVLARVRTHLRVKRLERQLRHELAVAQELAREARARVDGALLGDSPAAVQLRGDVERIGRSTGLVVIAGPAGCGGEAVARAIHDASERAQRPLILVDGLEVQGDPSLLEARRALARSGTLYLTRPSRVPDAAWQALVPKLTEPDVRTIVRIQPGEPVRAELRSAASHWITLPALADRAQDVPLLADHLLKRQAAQLGRQVSGLSDDARRRLQGYPWPGNLRELAGVLECALVTAAGPVVDVDEALLEGGRRAGHYKLLEPIRSGAMGEVWRARHRLLKRDAAVKLIHRHAAGDPEKARVRFEREARVTSGLESPHTVRLYDFGLTDEGDYYYVMELLRGMDLAQVVEGHGPIPASRAVHLAAQAAGSLAEAHAAGLVHCDIKPENLFVSVAGDERDVLKVLDFGVVRDLGRATTSDVVGTPAFLAPELAGDVPIDGRADLYSLGCVLYFALTGKTVFQGGNVWAVMIQHIRTPAPRVSASVDVPRELDDLVAMLLEKRREDRPSDARDLRRRLLALDVPRWTPEDAAVWWAERT